MKVNFSDFTNKIEVHNYLLDNSKLKIIKVESRLLDEDGVVLEQSDDFLTNCGDIKYYFENDKSLEINRINSVAIFVYDNGNKREIDYINNNNFELEFVSMLNKELGTSFEVKTVTIKKVIQGTLTGRDIDIFNSMITKMNTELNLKVNDL